MNILSILNALPMALNAVIEHGSNALQMGFSLVVLSIIQGFHNK